MSRILLLEDDEALGRGICMALETPNCTVTHCSTRLQAIKILQGVVFDLLILDINLPDGSGLELLRTLRQNGTSTPAILLTANDLELDEVTGLEAGADDYITKPFSLAVLRARVNAQLRRSVPVKQERIELNGFILDFTRMEFSKEGTIIDLSKTEQRLLRLLVENRGRTLPRELLLEKVWDGGEFVDENALSVAVRRLRGKLGNAPDQNCVRGWLHLGGKQMTALTWVLLAFAVIGLLFGLWQWTARRRTVQRLDNMLEQSISSGFTEEHFDETELSALETKFARFLRGSAHTQKTMKTEQEAVKTLISDISHQTRTPIANLLVYASLLTESDLSPRQREQVQALLTQGEKLSFLIQTLVKASRLETGIVVPTPTLGPVAPLLEATVEQERPAAEKKKITLQNLPFVGDASFDPRWTSEALGNVVNNAVKYTPAGGRVTVSAQMLETFCRVDVTDTGPGIPEEEQGGIFNRFYRGTLTHSAEGLGLGLYLAREILSLQGGYIKVSSKPGNGSTFSLYLPRALNRI